MANPTMRRTKEGEDDFSWLMDGGLGGDIPSFDIPGDWFANWGGGQGGDGTDGSGDLFGDPWASWGGGQGGDGTDGSGDFGTGGTGGGTGGTGGTGGIGGLTGNIGSWLARTLGIGSGTGGGTGGDGGSGFNPLSLLPLLAIAGGGINQNNNIGDAMDAMLGANRDATDFLRGQLSSTANRFKPYTDAGSSAVGRIQNMPQSNLSAQFQPLGSGRGMVSLGALAKRR